METTTSRLARALDNIRHATDRTGADEAYFGIRHEFAAAAGDRDLTLVRRICDAYAAWTAQQSPIVPLVVLR